MARNDGLKPIALRGDPEVVDKFNKFCGKHPLDPKHWIHEFALLRVSQMSEEEYELLFRPYYNQRIMRKRAIKVTLLDNKMDDE